MKDGVARCQEWLPRKNRRCAAAALPNLLYCGNHRPCDADLRIPCPVDPSHTILRKEAEAHARRCPAATIMEKMGQMPYYCQGINAGSDDEVEEAIIDPNGLERPEEDHVSSKVKRLLFEALNMVELKALVKKIELAYDHHCSDKFQLTFEIPVACEKWASADIDRRIPFQERHILQQASMLGNMESFGLLQCHDPRPNLGQILLGREPVFIEFGAGRGYLAHMLADCYHAQKIMLVERRSYKFKADRTLRQNADVIFDRVRLDIADLNLDGFTVLHDRHYVALSKHLCGHATDLTLRCCNPGRKLRSRRCHLDGIAIATCCHHLCQWKPYVNKKFFKQLGFSKTEFLILTWLTSGAVSGHKTHNEHFAHLQGHSASVSIEVTKNPVNFEYFNKMNEADKASFWFTCSTGRAELGIKCKRLLDVGRFYWLKELGMHSKIVAYAPPEITPENTLLLASNLAVNQE